MDTTRARERCSLLAYLNVQPILRIYECLQTQLLLDAQIRRPYRIAAFQVFSDVIEAEFKIQAEKRALNHQSRTTLTNYL